MSSTSLHALLVAIGGIVAVVMLLSGILAFSHLLYWIHTVAGQTAALVSYGVLTIIICYGIDRLSRTNGFDD